MHVFGAKRGSCLCLSKFMIQTWDTSTYFHRNGKICKWESVERNERWRLSLGSWYLRVRKRKRNDQQKKLRRSGQGGKRRWCPGNWMEMFHEGRSHMQLLDQVRGLGIHTGLGLVEIFGDMRKSWRKWQPTPVFLPGESHGQRSLAGYSPLGRKELDITEQLTLSLRTVVSVEWWRRKPDCALFWETERWSERVLLDCGTGKGSVAIRI